jgi:transcriptional repressor NrdR
MSEDNTVRRRRQCSCCRFRFTTFERVEPARATVIKKDGREEPFLREKIIRGVMRAGKNTSITLADTEKMAEEIEQELFASGEEKITSHQIGNLVILKIKKLDEVAYLRFASVYKEFSDLETFEEEISRLK